MKKLVGSLMAFFMILCLTSICFALEGDAKWIEKTGKGTITAIDANNSEVLIKGAMGNEVPFVVDKKVDLSKLAVGDKVQAKYYLAGTGEVRKPTAEEKKAGFVDLNETLTVGGKATPGATVKMFQDVVKVTQYDKTANLLVVKGSRGSLTLNAANVNSELVKPGAEATVKFSQPYIISIKKK
jgi:hypothetical protein